MTTNIEAISLYEASSVVDTMKLALEALEDARDNHGLHYVNEIVDLRQAIAAAEQHKQAEKAQPVAWMHWLHGPVHLFLNKDEAAMELERLNREYPVDADARKMRPLVFGDTAPPPRQPLMFPTMLRKMWSGAEVQAWLDENYNNDIKG